MRSALRTVTAIGLVTAAGLVVGCDGSAQCPATFLDVLNTILLGITAAGGIAIIRNI